MKVSAAELLATRVSQKTTWLFLRIEDAEGHSGWGECSLSGMEDRVEAAARKILPGFPGDIPAPGQLIDSLDTRDLPRAALASAICQAVRDLAAQRAGTPLCKALGGPDHADVPLYANINRRNRDRHADTMAGSALLAQAAGFGAFKIAPFDEVTPGLDEAGVIKAMQPGLARMAAVRRAVGRNARLMIDCHWRFDPVTAAAMIRATAEFNPWWIECPVPETEAFLPDIVGLRALANRIGIRLAGLEMSVRVAGFLPWVEAGAYDVMMPDVKYAGGPDEMLRIAESLAKGGVTFSPHNPTGPISHLHSAHVCAACPGADLLEHQFDETPLFAGIATPPLQQSRGGAVRLLSVPGLGAGIDLTAHSFDILVSAGDPRQ